MKKIIGLILLCLMSWGTYAHAAQITGRAEHTDIVAYINHYAIPSYAVNGTSVVVAEDLRNYGFNVDWDGEARTLSISRNSDTKATPMSFYKERVPNGTKFADIYKTDIKVYANGQQVTSYAINGYTMIPMEELSMFGDVIWVSEIRALKMWIDGMEIGEYSTVPVLYSDYGEFESEFNDLAYLISGATPPEYMGYDYAYIKECNDSASSMLDRAHSIATDLLAKYNSSYAVSREVIEQAARDKQSEILTVLSANGEYDANSSDWMTRDTYARAYWDASLDILKQHWYALYRYEGPGVVGRYR